MFGKNKKLLTRIEELERDQRFTAGLITGLHRDLDKEKRERVSADSRIEAIAKKRK